MAVVFSGDFECGDGVVAIESLNVLI